MNSDMLINWLSIIIISAVVIGIIVIAIRRFRAVHLRWTFVGLSSSALVWSILLFLIHFPMFSNETLLWMYRIIFANGCVMAIGLILFLFVFGSQNRRPTLPMYGLLIPLICTFLIAFTRYFVTAVHAPAPAQPVYGSLVLLYPVGISAPVFVAFIWFHRQIRSATDDSIRYQMRLILVSFALSSFLIIISGSVLPIAFGYTELLRFGPYLIMLPCASVCWIVIEGKRRLLIKELQPLLNLEDRLHMDLSYQSVLELIRTTVDFVHSSDEGNGPGHRLKKMILFPRNVRIQLKKLENPVNLLGRPVDPRGLPPNILHGLLMNSKILESENQQLQLENLCARTIIEKYVTAEQIRQFETELELEALNMLSLELDGNEQAREFMQLILKKGVPGDFKTYA